jgi:CRISPR-associated protein Csm1
MSLQVFLQAQLLGTEEFLGTHSIQQSREHSAGAADLIGRCAWLSLMSEVLPRALLSELKLSRMLLGSSSAEQFLLVLADETIPFANEFLSKAAEAIAKLSGHTLRLVWSSTENLGSWPIARKRLDDALLAKAAAPLSGSTDLASFFSPLSGDDDVADTSYFASLAEHLPVASKVGWSAENPAHLLWDQGQYQWPLKDQSGLDDEGILFPRRFALDESGTRPASLMELASRAEGAPAWAILRGDIDHFDVRLRRSATVEEHIHLSMLFKEFFAGELALLCTLPDFWRKVTILARGGDDFAVLGTWDALVLLAREIERLFEKFAEANLHNFTGMEGKTLTMALAIAPDIDASPVPVFEEAGVQLRSAKAVEAGTFYLFGRTLEWKRLADAEELKSGLVRMVHVYRFEAEYIHDLASVYREAFSARATRRNKAIRVDKPWRTYMRLSRIMPISRAPARGSKDFLNLRNSLIANLVGRKTAGFKLRPSARVGLEWARMAAGD